MKHQIWKLTIAIKISGNKYLIKKKLTNKPTVSEVLEEALIREGYTLIYQNQDDEKHKLKIFFKDDPSEDSGLSYVQAVPTSKKDSVI